MTVRPQRRPSRRRYRFDFLGFVDDGWYALRADLTGHPDVVEFRNDVIEWLIERRITPNQHSYVANGNTGDGPFVPSLADGSGFCVLLRRPADVIRFSHRFPCNNITADAIMAALRAEAAVPRIWVGEIAEIAHAAVRRLYLMYHRPCLPWERLPETERLAFRADIQFMVNNAHLNDAERHEAWVEDRRRDGWRFGELNRHTRRHPAMVPYNKLSPFEAARHRIVSGLVTALLPLTV
jgi:hypothetical protein